MSNCVQLKKTWPDNLKQWETLYPSAHCACLRYRKSHICASCDFE